MGRHRTKIDNTLPPTVEQPPKKRKHGDLEPASLPNGQFNGHGNGSTNHTEVIGAEERQSKRVKKDKKRSKKDAPTATEPTDAPVDAPPKRDEDKDAVVEPSAGPKEIKKPKKPKKKKMEVDTEEEEKSRKKYDAIFAKYQKAAELAEAEKAKMPPVAEAEEHATQEADGATTAQELHDLTPFPQPEALPEPTYKPTFSALPPWLAKPITVPSTTTDSFADLNISPKLRQNLEKKGLKHTLAVQSAVIPLLIPGAKAYQGDVCVSAATGSGKTLAYMLPMIESLKHKVTTRLRGLIVVPTRELVAQAHEVASMCAVGTGLHIATAVGNIPLQTEQEKLLKRGQRYDPPAYKTMYDAACKRLAVDFGEDEELQKDLLQLLPDHIPEFSSKVDILICTPGRLVDHIQKSRGFSLTDVDWLVIDEADRLLDESFQEWVTSLLNALHRKGQLSATDRVVASIRALPQERRVRKIILSATMTRDLSKLASLQLKRPTLVALVDQTKGTEGELDTDGEEPVQDGAEKFELPNTLSEHAIPVGDGTEKPLHLYQILQGHVLTHDPNNVSRWTKVKSTPQGHSTLVFTHNNENASRLAYIIQALLGPESGKVGLLTKTSAASKSSRKTLKSFEKGDIQILIATDRASRGLDVPGIAHVINYDMPRNMTSYVHRVGRTARAGSDGTAWTLFSDAEARWFWNEIAKNEKIGRAGRSVERMMADVKGLDAQMRSVYEKALQGLQSLVMIERAGMASIGGLVP